MEFDQATRRTNSAMDMVKEKYENAGYKMPGIVFWNVNGRMGNVPVSAKDSNTALVSGFSPSILQSILSGNLESPLETMIKTIKNERYEVIKA